MKKVIGTIFISTLIVPQIALAAWWNPFSWFNNWSFERTDSAKTQVLEKRIEELSKKLEEKSKDTNQTSEEMKDQEKNRAEEQETSNNVESKAQSLSSTQSQYSTQNINYLQNNSTDNTTQPVKDFRAECSISTDQFIEPGKNVTASIEVFFEQTSNYSIEWSKDYLIRDQEDEAIYKITDETTYTITANITRKSDGYKKTIKCPILNTVVLEQESEDFNYEENTNDQTIEDLKNTVNDLISLSESWDSDNGYWVCHNGDPQLENLSYLYYVQNKIGAPGLPSFNRNTDCSDPGLKNYRGQLETLLDNL